MISFKQLTIQLTEAKESGPESVAAEAKKLNTVEAHIKAAEAFKAAGDKLADRMNKTGQASSPKLGYYDEMETKHRNIAKNLKTNKSGKVDSKRIIKTIGYYMTITLNPKELTDLRFFMHSPKRMCITLFDTLYPEVWIAEDGTRLTEMGLSSLKELTDWLLANGAKQTKKPVARKPLQSIYDSVEIEEAKSYRDMNPAERTAARIAQNKEIDARVEKALEIKRYTQDIIDGKKRRESEAERDRKEARRWKNTKSCFGCGLDYLERHKFTSKDLAKMKIDGDDEDVCPDCVDDVLHQYPGSDFV